MPLDRLSGIDLQTAIAEAASQMDSRLPEGTEIAIVSIASYSTQFSEYAISNLESALVRSGKLVVVDRANLDKVRAEQGFMLSGEVSDESAKEIGRLLGADAIVTGSFVDLGDVYGLTLKAINMETAAIAASYLGDVAKSTRIETLLAFGAGTPAGSNGGQVAGGNTATSGNASTGRNKYLVTFDGNGANGNAPAEQTVNEGGSIALPNAGSMRNSIKTLAGLNTQADGFGTSYAVGASFRIYADTTFFAQWATTVKLSELQVSKSGGTKRVVNFGDIMESGGSIMFNAIGIDCNMWDNNFGWLDYNLNGEYSGIEGYLFNTYEGDVWTSDATLQLYGDETLLLELTVEKGEKAMRFETNLDGIDVLKLSVWGSTSHRVGVGNVTLMMLE
jgi:hypothetical protein